MVTFGKFPTTLCQEPPLFIDSNNPISVPAHIIFESCGITRKLYTATSGKPFDDFPETFKWKPERSFQDSPKFLVSIIFASPAIPNNIYAVESSLGCEYKPVIVPKFANFDTGSNVAPQSLDIKISAVLSITPPA